MRNESQQKDVSHSLLAAMKKIQDLEASLQDSQRQRKQTECIIKFLRERSEGAKLESMQLQKELKVTQSFIENLAAQYKQAKDEATSAKAHLEQMAKEREEALEEVHALQQQFKQLKDQIGSDGKLIEELQQQLSFAIKDQHQFRQKTDYSHQLESDLNRAKEEIRILETSLKNARALIDEKEYEIKCAQQHLGKKMKEASQYSDRVEEQKTMITDLHKSLKEAQGQYLSLQQMHETKLYQEKTIQEKLKGDCQKFELQAKLWEEKYSDMHARCQDLELQLQYLKSIEEKHSQMQSLLASFGSLMNHKPMETPVSHALMHPPQELTTKLSYPKNRPSFMQPAIASEPTPSSPVEQPSSLFGYSEPPIRLKQTLFD